MKRSEFTVLKCEIDPLELAQAKELVPDESGDKFPLAIVETDSVITSYEEAVLLLDGLEQFAIIQSIKYNQNCFPVLILDQLTNRGG